MMFVAEFGVDWRAVADRSHPVVDQPPLHVRLQQRSLFQIIGAASLRISLDNWREVVQIFCTVIESAGLAEELDERAIVAHLFPQRLG